MRLWPLLLLLLCSLAFAQNAKRELRIGFIQENLRLNPLLMKGRDAAVAYQFVGRALVARENNKLVPQLVEKIPSLTDHSATIVTHAGGEQRVKSTWQIRHNVVWGDGVPLTCEDLIFSRLVALEKTIPVSHRQTYKNIDEITYDANKPTQCTLLSKNRTDYNDLSGFYVIPAHLEKIAFANHVNKIANYADSSLYKTAPANPGLYLGPYRVSAKLPSGDLTLVPMQSFFSDQPKIDAITLTAVPNRTVLQAKLLDGELDMIRLPEFQIEAAQLETMLKKNQTRLRIVRPTSGIIEHIDFNLVNPILRDVRVRQALLYALNRHDLLKALDHLANEHAGADWPWSHVLHSSSLQFAAAEEPTKYSFSRRRARTLLDEAGWLMHDDGFRYKEDQRLALVLTTAAGTKVREETLTSLQSQWRQVGIDIIRKEEPAATFFSATVAGQHFEHMALYAWDAGDESALRAIVRHLQGQLTKSNLPAVKSAEFKQLSDLFINELNPTKRNDYLKKIINQWSAEVPLIPLYVHQEFTVYPSELKGYDPLREGVTMNSPEQWSFAE